MKLNSTFFRKAKAGLLSLLLLGALVAGAQTKHVVQVADFSFSPAQLTVNVGDTVEWQNIQGYHNVNGTKATFSKNPESFGNSPGSNWTYFFVFNTAGLYDYQCDPHASSGMTGKIEVKAADDGKHMLTLQLSNMTPHVGQMLYLALIDKDSGEELSRQSAVVSVNFAIEVPDLEDGHSYYVNFYADHNGNGMYDAPPADHAWQLELDNVTSDTTLTFTHNTNFTDIMWENQLTVNFFSMTPHVGQMLYLALVDKDSGEELLRTSKMVSVNFSIQLTGIEMGHSYYVNFYADHNGNGKYDAPPADHAWQLNLDNVLGDTALTFTHNTSFTDIMWKNQLTLNFQNMTPHVGQMLYLALVDKDSGEELMRTSTMVSVEFSLHLTGIEMGHSYFVNFYADHNGNGMYDAPPADHAWQLNLDNVAGDTALTFTHNTNFTDIMWENLLTINFHNMNPHDGQQLHLWVIEQSSGTELFMTTLTASPEFSVMAHGIENGKSYHIDFYADHNGNGSYDAPPTDHAWRLELNNVAGDTTFEFTHNTSFTDIFAVSGIGGSTIGDFVVYPNPAGQKLSLEFAAVPGKLAVELTGLTGKVYQIRSELSGQRMELDLSNLAHGVYLLSVDDGNSREVRKIVKR